VNKNGDTQARFLAKEPGRFSDQHSAVSIQPKRLTAKGAKTAKKVGAQDFPEGDGAAVLAIESSGLAPYHRPPFRASLLRDNCINYRTGNNTLDPTLG
jgi:hypothetical protein